MQLKPYRTEKSLKLAHLGQYVFAVDRGARKPEIKRVVEKTFGVNVVRVHTEVMSGKPYRTGRKYIKSTRPDWKKAIIKVKSGQKIDLFEAS